MMPLIEVDRAIKEIWINNISTDYTNGFLLLEDSLKNALYSHLRTKLTDRFLLSNNIRIFTELKTENNERIDIAVVRIDDNKDII
ncbi:hypothetical protein [Paenibacillus sp. IITD108]|uniref:hypothetical protein n=1 Tax=Paenibacillus sp. IITD108 TaxID=3116649 RepID=UPI002F3FE896